MDAIVARRLADLSTREIVSALGATDGSALRRAAIALAARLPSARLGRVLARFDARVGAAGLSVGARETLEAFGVSLRIDGAAPREGSMLVVTNHPGAYDALAAMAALGRDDVAFLAADRAFLRALPHVRDHLVFVDDASPRSRASGLRRALAWLERGGALVHYGAGAIEPDARFDDGEPLRPWGEGTGLIAAHAARRGAKVVPAFVAGVHSARAKKLWVVRWAERRGTTTVAPLIQAAVPGFRDVTVSVRIGSPVAASAIEGASSHAARTAIVRHAVASLRT